MVIIFFKEFKFLAFSASSAILLAIYAFVFSVLLYFSSMQTDSNNIFLLVQYYTFFLMLANPLLGARLMAEELQQKTHQLLLASSISSLSIVIAKFLAAVVFYFILLVFAALPPFLFLFVFTAATFPLAMVLLALWQFFFVGVFCIAMGFFCSGLTESVFFASVIAIFFVLFFYLLGFFNSSVPIAINPLVTEFSLASRIENLNAGIFSLHDALYFLLLIVFLLAASLYLFERQRWKA